MSPECILMHIDRTHEITVAHESAGAAGPISSFGLVTMPTSGTPARCASFGAGEALYVGLVAFMGEVVDVLAIFPQGHALIVVSAAVLLTDTMRIADEEAPDLVFHPQSP